MYTESALSSHKVAPVLHDQRREDRARTNQGLESDPANGSQNRDLHYPEAVVKPKTLLHFALSRRDGPETFHAGLHPLR